MTKENREMAKGRDNAQVVGRGPILPAARAGGLPLVNIIRIEIFFQRGVNKGMAAGSKRQL